MWEDISNEDGVSARAADHGKDLPATSAVLLRSLFYLLSRPRPYTVRGIDNEQGSRAQQLHLRAGRRRILLGLLPARGTEQSDSGKSRGAALDRPHHDQLGYRLGRFCLYPKGSPPLRPCVLA